MLPEDAAEAIGRSGDVRELLTALVDRSLLHPVEPADPVEPRYRVLETIREYGLERLARCDEVDAVRGRHAGFFLQPAETADPYLRTSDQLRRLARLSAERDNLSAAIRWAAESGDADLAVRLGVALCWFWFLRDHPPESLDLLGRVLQARGPTARCQPPGLGRVGRHRVPQPRPYENAPPGTRRGGPLGATGE